MEESPLDSVPTTESSDSRNQPEVLELDVSKKLGDVRVVLNGLSRISSLTLYPDVRDLRDAQTVEELLTILEKVHGRLDKLELFNSVVSNLKRGQRPGDVDVVFDLVEKSPSYSIGVTTNQKAEANFELNGDVPGVLGSCNSLSLQLSTSGYGSKKLSGSYFMPRNFGFENFTGRFQLFTSQNDFTNYSSFSTNTKGISFTLANLNKRHKAIWELSMSDLYPSFNAHRRASEAVLRQSGRSIKNSLAYNYTLDDLSGETIPSGGQCTQVNLETGLPGGDRQFLKFDYNMLYARTIHQKLIMHMNLSMGYMRQLGSLRSHSSMLDRFHFSGSGGAGSAFRGFGYRGIGPCDHGSIFDKKTQQWQRVAEHTGGDCYGNLQLALHCPLEYKQYRLPMAFCFLNVGSLSSIEERKKNESLYTQALRDLRMSIGAGFSLGMSPGCWLEAFVAQPLLCSPHDNVSRLQLGFRLKRSF